MDSFLLLWTDHLYYTFHPFPQVHEVLMKVILIAQAWPRQHWFATLLGLSAEAPLLLPLYLDLISRDYSKLLHSSLSSLRLMAWKFHG